ncbi:hypothetical protein H6F89_31365 [Cyanobacteria bacterium FACHB-63]|nr:hypothetical protein [Cyanobacteria bacterium FACHB-63]
MTSVDEVERLTGYDFFEKVPESVQKVIESKVSEMVSTNMPQFEIPTF